MTREMLIVGTATYRGKKLSEMTRDELEEALVLMGNLYNQTLEQHSQDIDNLSKLRPRRRWWQV